MDTTWQKRAREQGRPTTWQRTAVTELESMGLKWGEAVALAWDKGRWWETGPYFPIGKRRVVSNVQRFKIFEIISK